MLVVQVSLLNQTFAITQEPNTFRIVRYICTQYLFSILKFKNYLIFGCNEITAKSVNLTVTIPHYVDFYIYVRVFIYTHTYI